MTDEILVQAVRRGDEAAMGRLIDRYARLLWSVAGRVLRGVGSEQDMEECVADVFICLWQGPEKFDPARGSLRSWLSLVARSRAIDRCRAILRRGDLPLDETVLAGEPGLPETLEKEDRQRQLLAAVETLEEEERDILLRRCCWEQKPREIAAALGLPVKTVENRLYRTKQRLRRSLLEQED